MLQKYVSSWSLDAEKVTLGGSAPSVLQPAYGSPKAATTTSGADTTLMFGQFWNAFGLMARAARDTAGLPAYGRKTTTVARFAQLLNAFAPMLVTEAGMVRLANALHPLKAQSPMLVTDDGIARLTNELHPSIARFSMLVTDDGIARLANDLHS